MAGSRRFACDVCGKSFYEYLVLRLQMSTVICLFCKLRAEYDDKISHLEKKIHGVSEENAMLRMKVHNLLACHVDKGDEITSNNKQDDIGTLKGKTHDLRTEGNDVNDCNSDKTKYYLDADVGFELPNINIIGDSMVKGQSNEFCQRRKQYRIKTLVHTYPGAGIKTISETHFDPNTCNKRSLNFLLAGTNDVMRSSIDNITDMYKGLMSKFVSSGTSMSFLAILPRFDTGPDINKKIQEVNRRLSLLCKDFNMPFVDTYKAFDGARHLFTRHGLHLNGAGKARLGRIIDESVITLKDYIMTLSKPGDAPNATPSTSTASPTVVPVVSLTSLPIIQEKVAVSSEVTSKSPTLHMGKNFTGMGQIRRLRRSSAPDNSLFRL